MLLPDWLREQLGGGIQISCFSDLPAGSGMGGSSILAAAILKSVATLLGKPLSNQRLVNLVSEVEQLLTTGGGWQDQIGGSFAAFKIARSPSQLPLVVDVEPLPLSTSFCSLFSRRTFLVYTGQQRLAKNTLINALRTFSVTAATSFEISKFSTVHQLKENAEAGYTLMKSLEQGSIGEEVALQQLGDVLSR
jgi:galactokinase/mevalonate kinase-like predicted kinase